MADIYEVVLAMDIRANITDDELAELRWHVGKGPRPEQLTIGTDDFLEATPLGDPDDPDCEWDIDEPAPVFDQRGAGWKTQGALVAELVRREKPDGWSLTVRQEFHPDTLHQLKALLDWLGPYSVNADVGDVPFFVGYMRFYEEVKITPFVLLNGRIDLSDMPEFR